jgi:putative ABC transport system ATP-binding protein
MGPSGCGKSTLLAILSGLLHPDAGEVALLGEDIWAMTDDQREQFRRRHCGFIFQQHNLFGALTAEQQIELSLRWASTLPGPLIDGTVREALRSVGLEGKSHLRPLQLSGGEKQRVAIARALAKKPALLFADEPTASLDWGTGEQILNQLRSVMRTQQTTVLLVTHDTRIIPLVDDVLQLLEL